MLSTKTDTKIQKFKVNGFKFFDAPLNFFQRELKESSNPITASAIAVYIGLHSECEPDGTITPQNNQKHFNISMFASKLDMPYSTVSTAFNELISRNLVTESLFGETGKEVTVYAIRDYEIFNAMARALPSLPTIKGKGKDGKLYHSTEIKEGVYGHFYIPFELLNTQVLANLVKKRDRRGLLELLQLFSGFTRDFDSKSKENLDSYVIPRNTEGLKAKLQRSAAKVREFFEIISPIFKVDFDFTTRNPIISRITRIRKAVKQIWVRQFKIRISEKCVVENDDFAKTRELEAGLRKEATHRLKVLKYKMNGRQTKGIKYAFKDEILSIAKYIEDLNIKHGFMRYAMDHALEGLDRLNRQGTLADNPGGFIRNKFKEAWIAYRENHLDEGQRIDIATEYSKIHGEVAPFMLEK